MFIVPKVWEVTYITNGQVSKMNRFKPAVLADIAVQANPSLSHHSTFFDGQPIETAMSLTFKEVEVITSEDHVNVQGQGY